MAYYIVGENHGMTAAARRLAICATYGQAVKYIGTLPNVEEGKLTYPRRTHQ